jgi:hypothetical protein
VKNFSIWSVTRSLQTGICNRAVPGHDEASPHEKGTCESSLLLGLWTSAGAATFTVSNTLDTGSGSLRQAILDLRNGSSGPDEITFAAVTGVITLDTILPTITGELNVTGPGAAALKISGNNRTQTFAR